MAPPTQPVIQFRRPQKPLTYSDSLAAGPFGYPGPPYTVAHLVEKMTTQFIDRSSVLMHAVGHYFPDCIVIGPPTTYDAFGGSYVLGYRCEECNLIFFGLDIEDYRHECMDGDQ